MRSTKQHNFRQATDFFQRENSKNRKDYEWSRYTQQPHYDACCPSSHSVITLMDPLKNGVILQSPNILFAI